MNNKSIFVILTLAAIAAMLVTAHSGILQQDVDAASKRDRVNKVLDEHIKRSDGTDHGDAVKKIKEKFNRDNGPGGPCTGC